MKAQSLRQRLHFLDLTRANHDGNADKVDTLDHNEKESGEAGAKMAGLGAGFSSRAESRYC